MNTNFFENVKKGLQKKKKEIDSKFLYDTNGALIFEKILKEEDYYLNDLEIKIIKNNSVQIAKSILATHPTLEVIELGAGDGSKTKILLEQFNTIFKTINYVALDICQKSLQVNKVNILPEISNLNYSNLAGDYYETYPCIKHTKDGRLVLFIGSSIGNFSKKEITYFLNFIKQGLKKNDYLLISFDLIKHPNKILKAYNSKHNKSFIFNILNRINTELGTDIDQTKFLHYPHYNPKNGKLINNIISLESQNITFFDQSIINLKSYEVIKIVTSKKFSINNINKLAEKSNLKIDKIYFDEMKEYAFVLFKK